MLRLSPCSPDYHNDYHWIWILTKNIQTSKWWQIDTVRCLMMRCDVFIFDRSLVNLNQISLVQNFRIWSYSVTFCCIIYFISLNVFKIIWKFIRRFRDKNTYILATFSEVSELQGWPVRCSSSMFWLSFLKPLWHLNTWELDKKFFS